MRTRLLNQFQKREKYAVIAIFGLALLHFIMVFVNPAIDNMIEYPGRSLDSTLQTPLNQYIASMFWIWTGIPFFVNFSASSNIVLHMFLSLFSIVSIPITLIILKKIPTSRKIIYVYIITMQISGLLFPNGTFFS